ncbi:MAG: protein kinase [Proteobacteria bacterium]|nr:protein kinase [Pseudomonadota bacterium]
MGESPVCICALEWIIRSLRFARLPEHHTGGSGAQWIIAIDGRKGLSTLVQFLHARENMYRLVYHHKTTRAASKMLGLLFDRASKLAKADQLECPIPMMKRALKDESIEVETYLRLDDSDVWSSLKYWADGENCDHVLADLSRRILKRDLFKVFVLSDEVYNRLRKIDSEECGYNLRKIVAIRLDCSKEDAVYYYAFDATEFDVIGRATKSPLHDVWIMNAVPTGFKFTTLREYWKDEIRAAIDHKQHLLVVHPDVVQDLANVVERLSFPASSEKTVPDLPKAPDPYRVIAPLGAEGAWKEVYVGVHCNPGSASKNIVALKRYKSGEDGAVAIDRDVKALNLLIAEPHPNLQHAEVLTDDSKELWIIEHLWTASLEDLIKKQGPRRNLIEIFEIAAQLFSGLAALHGANLRHTDIKPDNCGIIKTDRAKPQYILGDFGCLSLAPDEMPKDRRLLGTLRTQAPEVIKGDRISLKSDVWAMGATVYAICTRKYPFMEFEAPHHDPEDRQAREREIRTNLDKLVEKFLSNVGDALPPKLSSLLQPCFEVEQERATADLVSHSFRDAASRLSTGKKDSSATAWQRAEDIFAAFFPWNSSRIDDSIMSEIKKLIDEHQDFISPKLIRAFQEILKEPAR